MRDSDRQKDYEARVEDAMALFSTAEMRESTLNKEKGLRRKLRDCKVGF